MKTKIDLLYEKYKIQMAFLRACEVWSEELFAKHVMTALSGYEHLQIDYKGQSGLLYYKQWQDAGKYYCVIPSYGYYANSENMMVRLFQKLAEEVLTDTTCEFQANVYSHDAECLQALHMMQFGTMAEVGLRRLSENMEQTDSQCEIRWLPKKEIALRWDEIWSATEQIILHLRKSPVFYPGREFTEEVYRSFYMSGDVELIAALKDDKIIGIIEWNREANPLLSVACKSVNVGEVYVVPPYRGTGLSAALLAAAESRARQAGAEMMWVEHGTANPNARGFWNKYFQTCQYQLVRTIVPIL